MVHLGSLTKNHTTPTPKTESAAPTKTEPKAEGYFSKWTWKEMAKYGALTAGALVAGRLAYSQILETASKIPETVRVAHAAVTKGIPNAVHAVNDVYDSSQTVFSGIGHGIAGVRKVASIVTDVPPMPATPAEYTALGYEFAANSWTAYLYCLFIGLPLYPVYQLTKPVMPKAGPITVAAGAAWLALQTAVPGITGKAVDMISSVGRTIKSAAVENPIVRAAAASTISVDAP